MQTIAPRSIDLAGLEVSRLLPTRARRLVGPWCFLDLMGPLSFTGGKPMDVPPHPHIGLQTVTWLLEGEALHKDSLGSEATAGAGTLHLMTSGRGIAHSEETPPAASGRLHGVQLWIALPDADRHGEPSFERHTDLPILEPRGARVVVFLGRLADAVAPGRTFSPVVGAEIILEPGAELTLRLDDAFEHAIVPLVGGGTCRGQSLVRDHLYCFDPGERELRLSGGESPSRILLIGGAPFREPILMWWNFVARTSDEIAAARDDWQAGRRFGAVRAYDGPRLAAPEYRGRAVPANPMS